MARKAVRTSYVRPPSRRDAVPKKNVLGMFLCIVLPPVGIYYLWRNGLLNRNGRLAFSALATVEMGILASLWLIPAATVQQATPVAGTSALYTPAPESDVVTALSNMDQLLRVQQAAESGQDTTLAAMSDAERAAANQAILNTTVYAVYSRDARYYHSKTVCGNQSNLRTLTVAEALADGLGPCPDCNPPVYSELGATTAPE